MFEFLPIYRNGHYINGKKAAVVLADYMTNIAKFSAKYD